MEAPDGKMRLTDVADTEQLFMNNVIVQTIHLVLIDNQTYDKTQL